MQPYNARDAAFEVACARRAAEEALAAHARATLNSIPDSEWRAVKASIIADMAAGRPAMLNLCDATRDARPSVESTLANRHLAEALLPSMHAAAATLRTLKQDAELVHECDAKLGAFRAQPVQESPCSLRFSLRDHHALPLAPRDKGKGVNMTGIAALGIVMAGSVALGVGPLLVERYARKRI